MNIKNHGTWQRYRPEKLPQGAPSNALFARRAGDGVDWYDYVNSGRNFAEDTVKLTVIDGVVGAATADPTALFPGGAVVLEIDGVSLADPQKAFGTKIYDAAHGMFRDQPPMKLPPSPDELLKRIEALEAKGGE